ncbi:hypothetical protein Tco_0339644, partial [Tanacetum coccineum]
LKRLRRGFSSVDVGLSGFRKGKSSVDLGSLVVNDDDIEDFSSPEDNNAKGCVWRNCSSSSSRKSKVARVSSNAKSSSKQQQLAE